MSTKKIGEKTMGTPNMNIGLVFWPEIRKFTFFFLLS